MSIDQTFTLLRDRLAEGCTSLADKPEETPESTLRALWHTAAGQPKSAVAAYADLPALDEAGVARLHALIDRRLSGVPLAHLTHRQDFLGMEMLAGSDALVPRKETELLGRAAIELAQELARRSGNAAPLVIDVCTGCGNIALAIAQHVPTARVFCADLSEDAIALARRNADWLGLGDRVEFRVGDLLVPFDAPEFQGSVDLITCNPPYISSGKVGQMAPEIAAHEPRLAFDGGPLGVSILMRLLQEAPRFLAPGGGLAFEVGLGQGPALMRRLQGTPFAGQARALTDANGDVRAIVARC